MVVFVNSTPKRLLLVKGGWSLSWRNSKKNLIPNDSIEDEEGKKSSSSNHGNTGTEDVPPPKPKKNVQFWNSNETEEENKNVVTEIVKDDCSITSEEMRNYWYQVSLNIFITIRPWCVLSSFLTYPVLCFFFVSCKKG